MLRVEVNDSADTLTLKVQGRLVGKDATNTRSLTTRRRAGMRLTVDLTELTFIDAVGEDVLSYFGEFGADFVAQTAYALDVCERLHLRLAQSGASHPNRTGVSRKNGSGRGLQVNPADSEQP